MITAIVKRDGRITTFDPIKISEAIRKAVICASRNHQCEMSEAEIHCLTNEITELLSRDFPNDPPTVEDVQEVVVNQLILHQYVETSKAYILYRQKRSMIRSQKSELMKTIHEITNASAKQSDIKRENANIDGNTAMGTMLQYGSTISKEYSLMQLLDPEHAQLHRNGDIHIHDLDFYAIGTLTCCQIPLGKLLKNGFSTGHGHLREPQDISSYAALAAIVIQSNQNDQHGGQSIPAFDFDMAEGVRKTYRRCLQEQLKLLLSYQGYAYDTSLDELIQSVTIGNTDQIKEKFIAQLLLLHPITLLQAGHMITFAFNQALHHTDKKTYQAMEALIHNLNTMHSRAGAQVPFSSLNFGTDTSEEGRMVIKNFLLATEAGLGNGETPIFPISIFKVKEGVNCYPGDPNYDLFQLACQVSSKRLFPNFSFIDAPFNKQYYVPGKPETEVAYMGCRTRVMSNIHGDSVVDGRGNLSFTTINLPRLGILHQNETDLEPFFRDLELRIRQSVEQLLLRFQLQSRKKVMNFPFLMGQGVWKDSSTLTRNDTIKDVIKHGTLSVGFIGLAECLTALKGKHHGESEEAQELGLKIIRFMRQKLDEASQQHKLNFSLLATPAEGLAGRFVAIDKKRFGLITGITDKDYYTNSFHIPVSYPIRAYEKIRKEAPYHALTNAGHITYVEVDGDIAHNQQAFEKLVLAMKDAGIGYGSINHPVDRDPVCQYQGVINGSICPKCGRNEETDGIPFERIRRITGYLVGTLDRFNQAKKAEERDRVKHG